MAGPPRSELGRWAVRTGAAMAVIGAISCASDAPTAGPADIPTPYSHIPATSSPNRPPQGGGPNLRLTEEAKPPLPNTNNQAAINTAVAATVAAQNRQPTVAVRATMTPERAPSVDTMVKEQVVAAWLNLLSAPQQVNNSVLTVSATQLDQWKGYAASIARTNTHPSNMPLKVSWIASRVDPASSNQKSAVKSMGEAEINNIRVGPNDTPLVSSNLLVGVTVALEYDYRFRGVFINNWQTADPATIQKWLADPQTDTLPPFTRWEHHRDILRVNQENGKYTVSAKVNDIDERSLLYGMRLPLFVMEPTASGAFCGRLSVNDGCRLISDFKLPS